MRQSKLIVAVALLSALVGPVLASSATLKCPACGMPMTLKKTTMMTVPVYDKAAKTVYYCCPMCKAGKAAAAYYKMHKKPMPV